MCLRSGSCVAYIYKTVAEREKWPKVPPAQENAEKRWAMAAKVFLSVSTLSRFREKEEEEEEEKKGIEKKAKMKRKERSTC